MPDLKISELPPLPGNLLQTTDPVAVADLSASETKSLTALQLATGIAPMFPAASIPSTAVAVTIPPGSIDTDELADDAVTGAKLADNSSAVVGPTVPTADYVGQLHIDTSTNYGYYWNGTAWTGFQGADAVGTITGGTGPVVISPVQTGGDIVLNTSYANSSGPAQFVAGPTGSAGVVGLREIIGGDLPTAGIAKGAVAISGNGLRMNGETLEINNDILASSAFNVVQIDTKGLVTGYQPIGPTDLPIATTTTLGAVIIGTGLAVSGNGTINLDQQSGPGEFTKVTINDRGIVTSGTVLEAADIPDLPAEKLTSGFLDLQRIADHTIERRKLAPYSIAFIQEAAPATDDASLFAGCLWFQESTAQLRMWNANAWTAVGFGRLAADNLRFGGTIDADTGKVTGVTSAGTTAGLTIGGQLPTATDPLGGLYLVIDTAGNNINVTPGLAYDPGDWVLCISENEGWVRIDTLSGGGGGGSDTLAGLLDTQISTPSEGDVLVYSTGALWKNEATLNGGTY